MQGPFPAEKYPGLRMIQEGWDTNPWTRVSFGQQWVLDPEGRYPLSFFYWGLDKIVEVALQRMIKIRSHPRGSAAEAEAIREVVAEIEEERKVMGNSPAQRTRSIFTIADGNLPERFPGVFEFEEVWVRRRAAELLGEYAAEADDEGFRPGGQWDFFGRAVYERLDDEEPEVRVAAAVAMHRFFGQEPDTLEEQALVDAAGALWTDAGGE